MTVRTFEPVSHSRRIWSNLQSGLIVGTVIFIIAFTKLPQYPILAALIGLTAGFLTFAPLAFNQPKDLQSIEISALALTVTERGSKRSLRWSAIARAYFRSYEGTRWVFVSPGNRDLVFIVEGFPPHQEEIIHTLIRMNLEANKVEILK